MENENAAGLEDGIMDIALTLSQKEYDNAIVHIKSIDEKIGRYLVLLPILLVPSMSFFIFMLDRDYGVTIWEKWLFAYIPFFLILFLLVGVVKKLIEALTFRDSYRMPHANELVESFIKMEYYENRKKENFQGYVLVKQEEVIKHLHCLSKNKVDCLKHVDSIIILIFILLFYWVTAFVFY